jgi:3-methyl-2-oxobutanoate hydroxymethyltransferase
MSSPDRRMTVPKLIAMKLAGRKITMLTAYDYTMAALIDSTGIEGILVGDTLSMVVQGHPNTLPVTLDEMIYHAEMVGRAVRHAVVVFDMPFLSYQVGKYKAIENAGRVLKETRCQAVKLEQGGPEQVEITEALVSVGIPVMAHFGLRPQSIHQLGGFSIQRDREQLLADAKAAEQAGAFSVLLECVPASVAEEITAAVNVPTIGIGAGAGCDGQILVMHDLLGLGTGRVPRHAKAYAELGRTIVDAVTRYRDDVRNGTFPGPEQTFD